MANHSGPTRATALLSGATRPRINMSKLSKLTGISRARLRALTEGAEGTAGEMAKLRDALDIPLEAWLEPADLPAGAPRANG